MCFFPGLNGRAFFSKIVVSLIKVDSVNMFKRI